MRRGGKGGTYVPPTGYGISDLRESNVKLKRIYEYEGRFYDKSDTLIYINNRWQCIADIAGVKRSFRKVY